ncbi:MAG: DNA polymerase III subunit delta' [Paracoccaceae bacterium]
MNTDLADIPEPDRVPGAPHPRETEALFGQGRAEAQFLESYTTGRLHHGWLLTGPQGIGKATLAWRIARFLLATPPDDGGLFGAPPPPVSLDIDAEHPVSRRLRAGSESGLFLLRRPWDDKAARLKQEITVEEVRRMKAFFTLSAADGGRRVAIVDSADDLNPSAANALLKLLEEPPEDVVLLLVSHQPARLLPTIRSRCRVLTLSALSAGDVEQAMAAADMRVDPAEAMRLAALAGGSVGEAIRLVNTDGLAIYERILKLMAGLPRLDRPAALALAESVAGKNTETHFALTIGLLDSFLARVARTGATGQPPAEAVPGEAALLLRLAPSPAVARVWADLQQNLGNRARRGRAVNLDPAALLMDMLLRVDQTVAPMLRKPA